jgi:hypothetical protein
MGIKQVYNVLDETAGAWLDVMPVSSNCPLGGGDIFSIIPLHPTSALLLTGTRQAFNL